MQYAKDLLSVARKRSSELQGQFKIEATINPVTSVETRVYQFKQELLASRIDLRKLRELAYNGIPDQDGLRAITWKLLLGYLPADPHEWDEVLARKRTQYLLFCEELVRQPKSSDSPSASSSPLEAGARGPSPLSTQDVTDEDHPLSLKKHSKWHTYFQDNEIMEQIDRDVMRTHPDMHFFGGETAQAEEHREEMKRALFLFAKLNPGLRYVQGMNELYAPLYYMFRTDIDRNSARHAEADAFFCFVDLISDSRDHFCQQLDNSSSGIKATIRNLLNLLQHFDPQLAHHLLVVNKVDFQFFSFRWITLLLTQEFSFPDAVRIWDTLLADPQGRMDCLMRMCLAMMMHVRGQLLEGDFAANVKLLQRYPSVDVNILLQKVATLPPCKTVLGRAV